MTWDEVIKIAIAIVGGFGGSFAVAGVIVKFAADRIAERLSAKYELRLNKELESFRTGLNRKNYVSKVRFDAEFAIYKDLSLTFYKMVDVIGQCVPIPYLEPIEKQNFRNRQESIIPKCLKSRDEAADILYSNAPFIDESFFDSFSILLRLCNDQINEVVSNESGNIMIDIHDKLTLLRKNIRVYLQSLEII